MLSNYKQSRDVHGMLPSLEPSSRSVKLPGRRPSTNRTSVRPAAIREEHDRVPLQSSIHFLPSSYAHSDLKPKESLHTQEKGAPGKGVQEKGGRRKSKPDLQEPDFQGKKKEVSPKTLPKPVIKEKPYVPVIKTNLNTVSSADKELVDKRRINRAQSENDLIQPVPYYIHSNTETQPIGNIS